MVKLIKWLWHLLLPYDSRRIRKPYERALLICLKRLQEDGPLCPSVGICSNANTLAKQLRLNTEGIKIYTAVGHYAKGWEHHSGKECFPIPEKLIVATDKWQGQSKLYRYQLIEYIINRIETETKD